jgi:hypothetical protein
LTVEPASKDIADAVLAALQMDDHGFIPELTAFATDPRKQ